MIRHKVISILSAALLSVVIIGCKSDNGELTIRIVETSDVHGHIFDTDHLTGEQRTGSFAKFSTFLNRVRKENKNVIYVDAGDMLQGTIDDYQDQTAQFKRASLPAEAFNLLGCFATVMGNHDFAVGPPSYDRYFRNMKCPVLGANVYFKEPGDYLPAYRIREIKGVRIAFLGMTTPLVNVQLPRDRRELDLADMVETAKYWMPILKEQEEADIVVGLLHSGYNGGRTEEGMTENAVSKLLSEVPGFDIILYGHDHRARNSKVVDCNGDSVLLLNPGPFMEKAAVATISVAADSEGKPIIMTRGELVDVTGEIPDKHFIKKLKGWEKDLSAYADSVIGQISEPLDAGNMLWERSTMVDFIHTVQMSYNSAEVSLAITDFTNPYIPAGDVKLRDMFGVYDHDNFMVSFNMKGSEIKTVLENSVSQFYNTVTNGEGGMLKTRRSQDGSVLPRRGASSLVTAAGIDYEIDVTRPDGDKIRINCMQDGTPFDPEKMYRTTVNGNQFTGTSLCRVMGITPKEMRSRLIISSPADIRFYMITRIALSREADLTYTVPVMSHWKLVPQDIVSDCLAKDTVGFNITQK
ncbi:MAG: bifunctional metallophosphatase/5'-nucleotidase [Bacteroidaceae bacterium]|nr:bifunctional metallophosphatase/5'-nucleotidase [Bacteroidaceae bacterium]